MLFTGRVIVAVVVPIGIIRGILILVRCVIVIIIPALLHHYGWLCIYGRISIRVIIWSVGITIGVAIAKTEASVIAEPQSKSKAAAPAAVAAPPTVAAPATVVSPTAAEIMSATIVTTAVGSSAATAVVVRKAASPAVMYATLSKCIYGCEYRQYEDETRYR